MSRGLATAISNATDDPFLVPVVFLELQFGSGTLRLHTDLGTITTTDTSPNRLWYGTGDLGSIDEIEETEEIAANAIRCRLSGIDSTILDEAVNQDYYEKPARILVTMRDTVTGALVANPHEIFYGKMDVMRVLYGKDQSAIEITLESELADFDKASMKYYSDAQLQRDYSGDLGLRYLAQVMDSRVMWGKNNATVVYSKGGKIGTQTPQQIIGNALGAFF